MLQTLEFHSARTAFVRNGAAAHAQEYFRNSHRDVRPPVRTASGQPDGVKAVSICFGNLFTFTRTRSRGLLALLPVYLLDTRDEGEPGGRLCSG